MRWLALALMLGLAGAAWISRGDKRQFPALTRLGFATALLLLVTLATISIPACGGGGGGGGGGGNPGTTPGTYTLIVSGTFASGATTLTHNILLTLTVN